MANFYACTYSLLMLAFRALLSGALGVFATATTALGVPDGGTKGIVATVQPIATDAAVRAFQREGNAIDAAVAAALTLGVVDGHNSGLGGGCFMLIRTATGRFVALDGRETAPARATRDMFVREGKADPKL